jgi:RimJ/RimL family protein N-acetyltransferase
MPPLTTGAPTIVLRKVESIDVEFIHRLFNDRELLRNDLSMHGGVSRFSLESNFDRLFNAPDWLRFIIADSEGGEKYGLISAREERGGIGAYTVSIAIADGCRSKGVGTLATQHLLSFLFLSRRAERVAASVRKYNVAGLAWARKCGFVEEGCERHGCFADGVFSDVCKFSILSSEYLDGAR